MKQNLLLILISLTVVVLSESLTTEKAFLIEAMEEMNLKYDFGLQTQLNQLEGKTLVTEIPAKRTLQEATQNENLRITWDYGNISGHSEVQKIGPKFAQYVQELFQLATLQISKLVKIRRNSVGPTYYDNYDFCYDYSLKGGDKGPHQNVDLRLFLNFEFDSKTSVVASAAACWVGSWQDSNMVLNYIGPQFGYINMNLYWQQSVLEETKKMKRYKYFEDNLEVLIHEALHIMGINGQFRSWRTPDRQTRETHFEMNVMVRGKKTSFVKTPNLVDAAVEHFGCGRIDRFPFENDGGPGSLGAHFELNAVKNEMMGGSVVNTAAILSQFSASVLWDTNYYDEIDEQFIDYYFWGKDKGCGFLEGSCEQLNNKNYPEFSGECQFQDYNNKQLFQSWNYFGFAYQFTPNQIKNSYYDCVYIESYQMNCEVGPYFDTGNTKQNTGQAYGWNSRAYYSNSFKSGVHNSQAMNFRCFPTECLYDGSLQISVGSQTVICGAEEGNLKKELQGDFVGSYLFCPQNIPKMCTAVYCKDYCSTKGFCVRSTCACLDGFAGRGCELECDDFNHNGLCVKQCPVNSFANILDRNCVQCHKDCEFGCTGPSPQECLSQTKCDSNCKDCEDQSPSTCTSCVPFSGLFLKDGKCVRDCGSGYFKDYRIQICEPCEYPCKTCQRRRVCLSCQDGLFNVHTQKCLNSKPVHFCNKPCLTCVENQSDQCTSCIDNFTLVGDKCEMICSNVWSLTPKSCAAGQFEQDNVCVEKCSNGYYLKENRCLKCLLHCESCTDMNSCLSCQSGFYWSNRECRACNRNCLTCQTFPNNCTSCFNNSVLQQNLCLTSCSQGYYQYDGQCLSCPANCLTCSDQLICQTCFNQYSLENGKCVSQVSCSAGQFFDAFTQRCKFCVPNCSSCTNDFSCLVCKTDYQLNNNLCELGQNCGSGQFYNQSALACQQCPANCKTCFSMFYCSQCQSGFNNKSGYCLSNCNIQNCEICQSQNSCSQCSLGFQLQNGSCIQFCAQATYYDSYYQKCSNCKPFCQSCNSYNHCALCSSGYQLSNNSCIKSCSIANCSSCNSFGSCVQCISGFSLSNGSCQPQSSCGLARYYDNFNQTCRNCTTYCVACSNLNRCTECARGYALMYGRCQKKCNQLGCYYCNNSFKCVNCMSGWSWYNYQCYNLCSQGEFWENNVCKKCGPNCQQCHNETFCTQCSPSYRMINGQCQQYSAAYIENQDQSSNEQQQSSYLPEDFIHSKAALQSNNSDQNNQGQQVSANKNNNEKLANTQSDKKANTNSGINENQQEATITQCLKNCTACLKRDPRVCTACLTGFSLQEGVCTNTEKVCEIGCAKCDLNGFCLQCNSQGNLLCPLVLNEGTCIINCQCSSNEVFDEKTGRCQACHHSCSSCHQPKLKYTCLACPKNREFQRYHTFDYGSCQCQQGQVEDQFTKECRPKSNEEIQAQQSMLSASLISGISLSTGNPSLVTMVDQLQSISDLEEKRQISTRKAGKRLLQSKNLIEMEFSSDLQNQSQPMFVQNAFIELSLNAVFFSLWFLVVQIEKKTTLHPYVSLTLKGNLQLVYLFFSFSNLTTSLFLQLSRPSFEDTWEVINYFLAVLVTFLVGVYLSVLALKINKQDSQMSPMLKFLEFVFDFGQTLKKNFIFVMFARKLFYSIVLVFFYEGVNQQLKLLLVTYLIYYILLQQIMPFKNDRYNRFIVFVESIMLAIHCIFLVISDSASEFETWKNVLVGLQIILMASYICFALYEISQLFLARHKAKNTRLRSDIDKSQVSISKNKAFESQDHIESPAKLQKFSIKQSAFSRFNNFHQVNVDSNDQQTNQNSQNN